MRSGLALLGVAMAAFAATARAQEPCEEWAVVAHVIPSEDSGIGGTGIYGAITGFGSVCVNGLRVHTDAETSVAMNGHPSGTGELAVGHVVWIVASVVDGRLHADSLDSLSAVVGPLRALDLAASRIQVGAQAVRVSAGTIVLDERGEALALGRLRFGDVLDVHGLRAAGGEVVATRVTRRPAGTAGFAGPRLADLLRAARSLRRLSFEGYVRESGAQRLRVGGLEVDLPPEPGVAPPAADTRVWVLGGVGAEGRVRAQRVTPRPPRRVAPDASLVPGLEAPGPGAGPGRAGDRTPEPDAKRRSPLLEVPIESLDEVLIVDPPLPPPRRVEPLPGADLRDPLGPRPDAPRSAPIEIAPQGVDSGPR